MVNEANEVLVAVDAYAGGRGQEIPRIVHCGLQPVAVEEILSMWTEAAQCGDDERRRFRLRLASGAELTLSYHPADDLWTVP